MSPAILLSLLGCLAADPVVQAPPPQETALPEVKVKGQQGHTKERADGPVKGYRAHRSATTTRTDTPLSEVPQSIQVVPEALVKDQGMKSMVEVLRYVPGASMNPGEGGRDQPVLRGISSSSDFYVDGLRDDALYFRDPYNAERIEVLKGPSGMTFGRGGGGGVINRVTKRPLAERLAEVELSLGCWSDRRASVDYSDRSMGMGFRVNAMAEAAQGFREGFNLRRSALNPVVDFTLGEDSLILLGLEHAEDRRTTDRGIPALNGRPLPGAEATFFGDPAQSPSRAVVDAFSARAETNLGASLLLRNALRVTRYDTLRQNVQPNSVVDPSTGLLKLSAYAQANVRSNIFNQTELEAKATWGGLDHHLLAGLELGHQDSDNTRLTGYFGSATLATVSATQPRASVTSWAAALGDTNNRVQADLVALYLQDQVTLSPRWKAVLGLRQDHFALSLLDRSAARVDLSSTDTALSPRADLIFQPQAAASYYLSYGYAFLPSSETLSLSVANADLRPEKATNWELGAKWEVGVGMSLTAALFRLDRADVKSRDPLDSTRLVRSGLQRTEGLELGFQGQVREGWEVYGGLALLQAEVLKATGGSPTITPVAPGTQVPLVPRRSATCWNKVDLGGSWSLGLGLIYQGSTFASTTNSVLLPAFTRLDAALFYRFSPQTRLALNLENLLDRTYYPTAGNDSNITVGTPRRVQLTLAAKY